jgi:lactate racemase
MLSALFEVIPRDRVTLVIATGTHRGSGDVVPEEHRDLPVIVHDAQDLGRCVSLGTTREGTAVHIRAEVAEADLVVVTGRLRPHYFAGYSGGVKGLFPGCAHVDGVLANHRLKSDATCRLGRVDGNRCRRDMEDAALRVPGVVYLLNVLADCEGHPVAAAAGHPIDAHRHLAGLARGLFLVQVPRSPVVIVADRPPVSRSLYQASKLLPPAGAVLEDGGTVILIAECTEGVEPLKRVNEAIYAIGVACQLPVPHEVLLVSELPREVVAQTYATPARSLEAALDATATRTGYTGPVPVIWRAGEVIAEALTPGGRGREREAC